MRVARIQIKNVMGVKEFELDNPGSFTTIEAKNGQGKTSIVQAILSVIGGGHDASLLRVGESEGEVLITLEDGTEIRKRITAGESPLTVRKPDIGNVGSPKKQVDRLFRALSVNPVEFLTLPEKEQAQALLEALPIELDRAEVTEAVGGTIGLNESDFRGHPLDVLSALVTRVYDERTGVNRAGKEKRATVDQLSQSLPEHDEIPADEITRLEAERDQIQTRLQAARDEIEEAAEQEARTVFASIDKEIGDLRRQLDKLASERQQRTVEIERRTQAQVWQVERDAEVRIVEIRSELEAERERERGRAATQNTRRVVKQMQGEIDNLLGKSKGLTAALAQLDALKRGLVRDLPIKGFEVREGVVFKGEVPFHRLNRAEQVKFAIRLAALQSGEVGLVCVDGIELLDGDTFKLFREQASKSGLQFIVTRATPEVGDSAPVGLSVETLEAVPA
jgi:ribosome-associated translation inhibitor RaiA